VRLGLRKRDADFVEKEVMSGPNAIISAISAGISDILLRFVQRASKWRDGVHYAAPHDDVDT